MTLKKNRLFSDHSGSSSPVHKLQKSTMKLQSEVKQRLKGKKRKQNKKTLKFSIKDLP